MRYRHVWPGALLLVSMVSLLGGLLVWGDHFLSPGPTGGIPRLLVLRAPGPPEQVAPRVEPVAAAAAATPGAAPAEPAADQDEPAQRQASERAPRPEAPPRWALELGSFVLSEEAERAEAVLNQAGLSTVRFRQEGGARLFSVTVPAASLEDAVALAERLKPDGFDKAVATDGPQGVAVRIAEGVPLRTAVKLSERVRVAGHDPRVVAASGRAGQITLRHGNFASRREAEAVGEQIARLGLPNEVVQIR